MLLNFSSWEIASVAGIVSACAIWSVMLGPSRTMLTKANSSGDTDASWHLSGNPEKGFAFPNTYGVEPPVLHGQDELHNCRCLAHTPVQEQHQGPR